MNFDHPAPVNIPGLCFEHRKKSMRTLRFTLEFKAKPSGRLLNVDIQSLRSPRATGSLLTASTMGKGCYAR